MPICLLGIIKGYIDFFDARLLRYGMSFTLFYINPRNSKLGKQAHRLMHGAAIGKHGFQ
jgi:hypothetical protein